MIQVQMRGFFRFSLFLLLLLASMIGVGVVIFGKTMGVAPWSPSFFESDPPNIELADPPLGIGDMPTALKLLVRDDGAGLDQVNVRLEQRDMQKDLLKKNFSETGLRERMIDLKIDPRELGLKEGDLTIQVSAFDKALWSNGSEKELRIRVDFTKPRIEVLTAQQNGNLGGTEMVFYRVVGRGVRKTGVEHGKRRYPGFPIKELDPSMKGYEDVYAAIFPIPFDFDDSKEKMRLFVKDDFGNLAIAPFPYRIARKKFPSDDLNLTSDFLAQKIPELLPKLTDESSDQGAAFKLINESLRAENERKLQSLFAKAQPTRLWGGTPLLRPLAAAPKASFAERRTYSINGQAVSNSWHMGVDLAGTAMAEVSAAAAGLVLYAEDLGIYGSVVVIDHGFGLATLYGHLSSIGIKAGDSVTSGQIIGRTGTTGLAGGDHLHFEVRLHGVPVNPIEWWDGMWIKDHIEEKIASVKRVLVGGSAE